MWNVIDLLYEGNLGCEAPKNIFDIASHLLRIEHQLLEWQQRLPPTLPLVQPGELTGTPTAAVPSPLCRLRVILTLRYLNLRVLAHRPVLQIYLAELGAATTGGGGPPAQQRRRATLHQVGANSMRLCVQSAASIVEIVSHVVRSDGLTKQMLGAWWFSLYYSGFWASPFSCFGKVAGNNKMHNSVIDFFLPRQHSTPPSSSTRPFSCRTTRWSTRRSTASTFAAWTSGGICCRRRPSRCYCWTAATA